MVIECSKSAITVSSRVPWVCHAPRVHAPSGWPLVWSGRGFGVLVEDGSGEGLGGDEGVAGSDPFCDFFPAGLRGTDAAETTVGRHTTAR